MLAIITQITNAQFSFIYSSGNFLSTALLFLINKDINSGESSCSWSLISLWWHWYCYSLWYLGGVSMFKVTIISFLENLFCRQLQTSWLGKGSIYFPRQKSGLWYGRHTHFFWAPREILKGNFSSKWQIFHGKIWTLNLDTRPHTFWTPKEIVVIKTPFSNFRSLFFVDSPPWTQSRFMPIEM